MILYIYDHYKGNRSSQLNTNQLIDLALREYSYETGILADSNDKAFCIYKTQKGKPYIEGLPLHFSVSHSEHMWVCLVGDVENGVDIQNKTHSNYEAISRRFFQTEEQKAVEIGGIAAFIAIWCRKEAFIKLFGLSIGDTIDWLDVAKDESPASHIKYLDREITFSEVDIHPDFMCVAAMDKKEEIWIRKIQAD